MDTTFYAVDERGYLYECFSNETGAVPGSVEWEQVELTSEEIPGRIGYARNISTFSIEALLNNEMDIYGNSYRYDIVAESTCKVDNTPLKDLDLPVFYGDSLIISPEDASVYNDFLDDDIITEIIKACTGNCAHKIREFKDTFDEMLERESVAHSDEEDENEYVLFWGFKDIAPASLLLVIPEFFTEHIYLIRKSSIPVVYESVKPVVSAFDMSERIIVNRIFKQIIKKFYETNNKQ